MSIDLTEATARFAAQQTAELHAAEDELVGLRYGTIKVPEHLDKDDVIAKAEKRVVAAREAMSIPTREQQAMIDVANAMEQKALQIKADRTLTKRIFDAAPAELQGQIMDQDHPATIADVDPDIVLSVVEQVRAEGA